MTTLESNPGPYRGSCLCGAVKFEVAEFEQKVANCHCSMCRKFHGTAFATIAGAPRSGFRWLQGESDLKSYVGHNNTVRTFCSHCGSSLTFESPNLADTVIEIALGVMDDDIPVRPDAHIFVDSGCNWIDLQDDLPVYSGGRDSKRIR